MKRIPEPELMEEWQQAEAYAKADFSAPHDMFVELFVSRFGRQAQGLFLDLGCGAADITIRMARRCRGMMFHAVDGSEAMLHFAKQAVEGYGLQDRIQLFRGRIPEFHPPAATYDGAVINSLLHHMPEPTVLWRYLKQHVRPGGLIFVMDLKRPCDKKTARALVERYSGDEPQILKRDFYNSLLAAFTREEITAQLSACRLALEVKEVSDRHLLISGTV